LKGWAKTNAPKLTKRSDSPNLIMENDYNRLEN